VSGLGKRVGRESPSSRTGLLEALELAVLVLRAADTAASFRRRETFIDLFALDPGLVNAGQGTRAARILLELVRTLEVPASVVEPRPPAPRDVASSQSP
jgi:hypothetical protein